MKFYEASHDADFTYLGYDDIYIKSDQRIHWKTVCVSVIGKWNTANTNWSNCKDILDHFCSEPISSKETSWENFTIEFILSRWECSFRGDECIILSASRWVFGYLFVGPWIC